MWGLPLSKSKGREPSYMIPILVRRHLNTQSSPHLHPLKCVHCASGLLWRYMAKQLGVNVGSGNGLVTSCIKPLPKSILTHHQRRFVVLNREWFHKKCLWTKSVTSVVTCVRMMTSSNENMFRITGLLCGEFTGHRWILLTKASEAGLWCFLWSFATGAIVSKLNGSEKIWVNSIDNLATTTTAHRGHISWGVLNFQVIHPLQWRQNEHDGVSKHQVHDCLLKRLFGRRSTKASKLSVTGLCAGNSPVAGESPHKEPVTRKMFPFDDVIMQGFSYTHHM